MAAQIEFKPNLVRRRGGKIILNALMTGQQIVQAYAQWLVSTHPELIAELGYDEQRKQLLVGYWDIEVDEDIVQQLDFEVYGETEPENTTVASAPAATEQVEQAAQQVDLHSFKAPIAEMRENSKPANAVSSVNPATVRAIISPQARLDVARIHGSAVLAEANSFADAAKIETNRPMQIIAGSAAVAELKHAGNVQEIEVPPPATVRTQPIADRVFIKNQPERQHRAPRFNQPQSQENTMGKSTRRNFESNDRAERQSYGNSRDNRNSSRAALTNRNAPPASPEMLSKLMSTGIGSLTAVDTSSFRNRLTESQKNNRPDKEFIDGKTCINVAPVAETELGRALRLGTPRSFEYPGLGNFSSLGGLYLLLIEAPANDYSYQTLAGARVFKELAHRHEFHQESRYVRQLSAEQQAAGGKAYYDWHTIFSIMADATWVSINKDENLVAALLENNLRLEAYMLVKPRVIPGQNQAASEELKLRYEHYGSWYLPILAEIVRTLRARLRAVQDGVSAQELPLPNFAQPIERAIGHIRKRVLAEISRYDQRQSEKAAERAQQDQGAETRGDRPRKAKKDRQAQAPQMQEQNAPIGDSESSPAQNDIAVESSLVALETASTIGVSTQPAGSVNVSAEQLSQASDSLNSEAASEVTTLETGTAITSAADEPLNEQAAVGATVTELQPQVISEPVQE